MRRKPIPTAAIWVIGILLMLLSGAVAMGHPGHSQEVGDVEDGLILIASYQPHVSIEVRGDYRFVTGNGIPDHETGLFPNRGNPHAISPQSHRYRMPAEPEVNDRLTPMTRMPFGVALNGVPLDPGTAEYWQNDRSSDYRYEAIGSSLNLGLDQANAHVQPTGAYHYHGVPLPLLKQRGAHAMTLIGYAADGFPIYGPYVYEVADDANSKIIKATPSYQLKTGRREGGPGGAYDGSFTSDWAYVRGAGLLDEANSRFGVTPEYPEGTYYYVLTDAFPYIPRFFRGTPDASFQQRGGPGGARNRGSAGQGDERRGPPGGQRPPRREGGQQGPPPRGPRA